MARKPTSTPEATDPFAKLATVDVGPRRKADSSPDTPTLTIPELAPYGYLHKLFKELESWRKGVGSAAIKDALYAYAIEEGVRLGKAPPNPRGIDGENQCVSSLAMTKKDERTKLEPAQVERFENLGITVGRKEYAPATLRVNPQIWARQEGKHIISTALACLEKDKEVMALCASAQIDFSDLFQIQLEVAYPIVGNSTIDDIFFRAREAREAQAQTGKKSNNAPWDDKMIRELLEIVVSPVITPRQVYCELPETLVETRKRLCPTPEDIKEAQEAAKKAAKQVPAKPRDPVAEALRISVQAEITKPGKEGRRARQR